MGEYIAKDKPSWLRFGDHIKVRRAWGLYSHHGVYIGNNNVLHLTGDPKRGLPALSWGEGMATVRIDDMKDFENGGQSLVVKAVTKDLDKSLFLREVRELINEDREYNLVWHNCEHFANNITHNKEESTQIHSAWYASGLGGISSLLGVYTLHTLTGTVLLPFIVTGLSFIGLQYV